MRTLTLRTLACVFATFGAASVAACSSDDAQGESQIGTVSVKLVGTSTSGASYRLRNGEFTVTGAAAAAFSTESDPDAASIAVTLPPGAYELGLADGWYLEKLVGGAYSQVNATLTSANPSPFSITSQSTTGVVLQFSSDGEIIQMGDGTLDVSINVDDLNCAVGQVVCNGACVSVTSDASNCGSCGNACASTPPSSCVNGICVADNCSVAGQVDCDGATANGCETSTVSDVANCGACANVCPAQGGTPSCTNGTCGLACFAGRGNCDMNATNGCETDTNNSLQNCGACNFLCNTPNGIPLCQAGMCTVNQCQPGFGNCDGQMQNGCEVLLNSNPGCGSSNLGSLSGDTAASDISVNGLTAQRFRLHVTENDTSGVTARALSMRFTLNTSGSGAQFGIEAACDGCGATVTSTSNPATVTLRWPEATAGLGLPTSDDSGRDVFVSVFYVGGTPPTGCSQWTLSAHGNVSGTPPQTCSAK